MNTLQQKIVCLENQHQRIPLAGPETGPISLVSWPGDLKPLGEPFKNERGWFVEMQSGPRRLAYQPVCVRVKTGTVETDHEIPSRIFAGKEFFLCLTTTTNFHWGHHPGRVAEMEKIGKGWPDLMGDPLCFHGHAYPSARYFAEGVHSANFPMTWLLDGNVAEAGAGDIRRWHHTHGDDVGILPASYFFKNAVNYNTTRTVEETTEALIANRHAVTRAFDQAGWPLQTQILGVDQWVGSLGTHWIKAAAKAGLRGVWGICHDHETCDTSVYHEGAPWEPYRMQADNFRYPSDDPRDLWAFQWTSRDLCNSFLHYPGSSVWFSTDPDDIKGCGILDNQPDYWDRIFENHRKSLDHSDFACMVIHNEDHDSHREHSQQYILGFLNRLPKDSVVPATLHEVLLWLELRYADGSHPAQLVESADPLRCHDIVDQLQQANPWVKDVWKPHAYWKSKNGLNPTVVSAYDRTARWYAVEGEYTPRQYIAYTKPVNFSETGISPKERIPVLTGWSERRENGRLTVEFQSDIDCPQLPLIFWNGPALREGRKTGEATVILADVSTGANHLVFTLSESIHPQPPGSQPTLSSPPSNDRNPALSLIAPPPASPSPHP